MAKSHLKLVSASHRKSNSCHAASETECRIADAGVSDRRRGREPDRGGQGQPIRPPRCHHDPCGLSVTACGVSELVDLRWDQIDFNTATLAVRRAKQGTPARIRSSGDELRALRKLQREQEPKSPFVFTSERGSPFTTAGFARLVERAGEAAGLGFKAHPHMLRHACGFALANKGHDTRALQAYLGHKNIQHTVRYTELSPDRFKDFWR